MSELEQLKAELESTQIAYQMVQEINQFKTGFLGRIAHELRSPLSSLISLHQLILFDFCENPEEEKQFLEQAYQSAQKLLDMIDEVILVSKLDYGAIALKQEPVEWDLICSELQTSTKLQATNRNLHVNFIKPEKPIQILADKNRLFQALLLLIDTGLEKMPKGSVQVTIQTESVINQALIEIKIPCSFEIWQQEEKPIIDQQSQQLEHWKNFTETVNYSPPMKLLLAQTLFQKMGGNLTISSITDANTTETFTRLQGSLQLVTPAEPN